MCIAFFEIISVVWCYGTGRLSANIKDMTGSYPNKFFQFCWIAVSPLLILVSKQRSRCSAYCQNTELDHLWLTRFVNIQAIWIFSVVDYKPVTYKKAIDGEYRYPEWAITLGWCITATSFLPIPLMAIKNVLNAKADGLWRVSIKVRYWQGFDCYLLLGQCPDIDKCHCHLQKFLLSFKTTIQQCPCGCEVVLDENYQAHTNSQFSLISGCRSEDIGFNTH